MIVYTLVHFDIVIRQLSIFFGTVQLIQLIITYYFLALGIITTCRIINRCFFWTTFITNNRFFCWTTCITNRSILCLSGFYFCFFLLSISLKEITGKNVNIINEDLIFLNYPVPKTTQSSCIHKVCVVGNRCRLISLSFYSFLQFGTKW